MRAEREKTRRALNDTQESEYQELLRRQFKRMEACLDRVDENTVNLVKTATVARVVMDAVPWLEEKRAWQVYASVLMPNHVHLLMRNLAGRSGDLLDDLARFRNFTAREVNRCLGRTGALWAREDFDHWCRTQSKVEGAVRYIAMNPVKAGLAATWNAWPWTLVRSEWHYALDTL